MIEKLGYHVVSFDTSALQNSRHAVFPNFSSKMSLKDGNNNFSFVNFYFYISKVNKAEGLLCIELQTVTKECQKDYNCTMKTLLHPAIIDLSLPGNDEDQSSTLLVDKFQKESPNFLSRTTNISQLLQRFRQEPWLFKCPEESYPKGNEKVMSWLADINDQPVVKVVRQRKVQVALTHLL